MKSLTGFALLAVLITNLQQASAQVFAPQGELAAQPVQRHCLFDEARYRQVNFKKDITASMTELIENSPYGASEVSDTDIVFAADQDYRVLGLQTQSFQTSFVDSFGAHVENHDEVYVEVKDSNHNTRLVHSSYLNMLPKMRIKVWVCK